MHCDKQFVPALERLLADTYVLYVKTQNYHWNVVGPRFQILHETFGDQYEALAEAVDAVAERLRALDVQVQGTLKNFLAQTSLKEGIVPQSEDKMLQDLYAGHAAIATFLNQSLAILDASDDEGTKDFFVERLRDHEKTAWMLKSHLVKEA